MTVKNGHIKSLLFKNFTKQDSNLQLGQLCAVLYCVVLSVSGMFVTQQRDRTVVCSFFVFSLVQFNSGKSPEASEL